MQILILGGTGYLGKTLTDVVRASGHGVVLLSRHKPELEHFNPGVSWFEWDRSDHHRLGQIVRGLGVDAVVDLSCDVVENLRVSMDVLCARTETYLLMSSTAVASTRESGAPELPVREIQYDNEPPGNSYASEKYRAEKLFLEYNNARNCRRLVLRTSEMVGDYGYREQYFFQRAAARQSELLIPDRGNNVVHPTDVRDVANAINQMLAAGDLESGIYQVAGPAAMSLENVLRILAEVTGWDVGFVFVPGEYISRAHGHFYFPFYPRNTVISDAKTRARLSFEPQYDLRDSFARSWGLFRSQSTGAVPSDIAFHNGRGESMLSPKTELELMEDWRYLTSLLSKYVE